MFILFLSTLNKQLLHSHFSSNLEPLKLSKVWNATKSRRQFPTHLNTSPADGRQIPETKHQDTAPSTALPWTSQKINSSRAILKCELSATLIRPFVLPTTSSFKYKNTVQYFLNKNIHKSCHIKCDKKENTGEKKTKPKSAKSSSPFLRNVKESWMG